MYEGYSRHLLIYLFLISKLDNWIHWIHFIHKISFHLYQNLADMLVLLSSPSTLIQSISTELLWMLNMSPRMDPLYFQWRQTTIQIYIFVAEWPQHTSSLRTHLHFLFSVLIFFYLFVTTMYVMGKKIKEEKNTQKLCYSDKSNIWIYFLIYAYKSRCFWQQKYFYGQAGY